MKSLGTLLLFIAFISISSCKDNPNRSYKPESIGSLNTLAVVMEDHLWEGEIGDRVRSHFAAPMVGLIWDEPTFSLEQIPQRAFTGTTRHRRAVLFVAYDSLDLAHIKTDLYASPQKVAVIKGRNKEEILQNIDEKAGQIIASIKQMEVTEAQQRFKRSLSKEKVLEERFGISLTIPSLYTVGKQEDNFVWIDMEIPKGSMNLIAYAMPWDAFNNDTTFIADIVKMRDSIGKKYIPGPDVPGKITHMSTEKAFAPHVYSAEVAGKKAAEVRGIWEIENYPMAGTFLTYIINDKERNRKLVLEGFTFAPSTNKRDYMFELEAIMKTLKFNLEKPATE